MHINVNFKPKESDEEVPFDWALEREFKEVMNVKFTLKDGTIVTVSDRGGMCVLKTADTQLVIAPEAANKVVVVTKNV